MRLILIRHGETDWNNDGRLQGHTDILLNARGLAQAEKLTARLAAEENIQVLYTSPLGRARRTAEIIGERFGLTPIPDGRLVERSAGLLEGLTSSEVREQHPDFFRQWRERKGPPPLIPGGETTLEFHGRVLSFLDMVRTEHVGKNVAIVTHGGTLAVLIAALLGLDLSHRLPFRFDNTSLNVVDLAGDHACLTLLNDTSHLNHSR